MPQFGAEVHDKKYQRALQMFNEYMRTGILPPEKDWPTLGGGRHKNVPGAYVPWFERPPFTGARFYRDLSQMQPQLQQPQRGIAAINQATGQPEVAPAQPAAPQQPQGGGMPALGTQQPSKDSIKQYVNEHPRLPGESDDDYRVRLEDLIRSGTRVPQPAQGNARQAAINAFVRREGRRIYNGETPEEYAERLRPGVGAAVKGIFGKDPGGLVLEWGKLPTDQRGPITAEEIAIAEQQPGVKERVAEQNQRRWDELQRERKQTSNYGQPQAAASVTPATVAPVNEGKQEVNPPAAAQEPSMKEKMLKQAQEANANRAAQEKPKRPFDGLSPEEQAKVRESAKDLKQEFPRREGESLDAYKKRLADEFKKKAEEIRAKPTTEPVDTESGGGDSQPAGAQPVNERGIFMLDRMNALLGQIRRTGRRATPTELTDIRNLYGDMNTAFGGNIPADIAPQVNRIKRDFNSQANLLNIRAIDEVAPDRNLAQQLGVPLDAQGNPNLSNYAAQFPQFFNNAERPALLNESQIKKEELPLFKKIRSDINAVNWANNIGEQGYDLEMDKKGNLKYPNRKDQMEAHKRQDAAYRASNEYKTTPLPAGLVTQAAAAQRNVPSYFDEDLPFQTGPVNPANYQQQPQAQQPAAQSGTIPGPTYNVSATTGGAAPISGAIGDPIQAQTLGQRHSKLGQVFLGGNSQLLQIPQYTPYQRDLMREMAQMGMESLRQAYQPLDAPERQQAAAQNAINLIQERLQAGDQAGAQQEIVLAGGLGNLQAAINGMPSQPIGQGVAAAQQAQQQAQAPQPMDERNQRVLLDRLQNFTGATNRRPWETLNPQEQAEVGNLYRNISNISNPIRPVAQVIRQAEGLYPNLIQPAAQPPIYPPAQPQTFDNRPAAGVLPRVRQGLAQAAEGVQGAEKMQGGVGNIRNAAQNFIPGLKEAWAQPGITPALDYLTQRGGQFGRGVGELFGGGSDIARSGQNIANIAQGRPMQPGAPVPPGTPGAGGGGAPMPQGGGLGALGLVSRGGGYGHPMPYTAANEMQRFYEDTVPTLAERFTAAGGGQRSAAFQGGLGRAGTSMGLGLGALGEQQQLAQQQQAWSQQQAQREFDALQRQRQQQLQRQDQTFAFNRGTALVNPALGQLTSQAILPGSSGILPGIINATGQAVSGGVKAASMFI